SWWRGMGPAEKDAWKQRSRQLGSDWTAAAGSGVAADSAEAQELARRQVEWLTGIPGTPASAAGSVGDVKSYVTGLGEMYVADPRFAANYGGEAGAAFVRDALRIYAAKHL
ncbi:MAG TPA: TipAS antibiotic-recognition domain-containing protein, partial [Arthrobacter sp.]|nr:TipAS antibiotic-recognition domain-containing protein [Arthrobacter sp.]